MRNLLIALIFILLFLSFSNAQLNVTFRLPEKIERASINPIFFDITCGNPDSQFVYGDTIFSNIFICQNGTCKFVGDKSFVYEKTCDKESGAFSFFIQPDTNQLEAVFMARRYEDKNFFFSQAKVFNLAAIKEQPQFAITQETEKGDMLVFIAGLFLMFIGIFLIWIRRFFWGLMLFLLSLIVIVLGIGI